MLRFSDVLGFNAKGLEHRIWWGLGFGITGALRGKLLASPQVNSEGGNKVANQ